MTPAEITRASNAWSEQKEIDVTNQKTLCAWETAHVVGGLTRCWGAKTNTRELLNSYLAALHVDAADADWSLDDMTPGERAIYEESCKRSPKFQAKLAAETVAQ